MTTIDSSGTHSKERETKHGNRGLHLRSETLARDQLLRYRHCYLRVLRSRLDQGESDYAFRRLSVSGHRDLAKGG
jgi:hypothetical protein